jgi:hypothetical protein
MSGLSNQSITFCLRVYSPRPSPPSAELPSSSSALASSVLVFFGRPLPLAGVFFFFGEPPSWSGVTSVVSLIVSSASGVPDLRFLGVALGAGAALEAAGALPKKAPKDGWASMAFRLTGGHYDRVSHVTVRLFILTIFLSVPSVLPVSLANSS